jgi:hypothetical protein
MRNGLVGMIAVLMTLAVPRVRLSLPVPDANCRARPRPLAWQLQAGQRRAHCRRFSWPAPGGAWRRARMIAEAPGRARRQLTPAAMGVS